MSRRPRVEEAGFHHVVNRGVAKGDVFFEESDYEKFLEILEVAKQRYDFIVHSVCLMSNHYHLLMETRLDNLSLIARQINSKYAQYFNKKNQRVGPLWQGRFKSWYVYDENYLYTLLRYIEQNPTKAKIVANIEEYSWVTTSFILNQKYQTVIEHSKLFDKELFSLISKELSADEEKLLDGFHKTTYRQSENKLIREKQKTMSEYFDRCSNKKDRNLKILEAFGDNYKQSEIARYLGLSNAGVSYIINNFKFDT